MKKRFAALFALQLLAFSIAFAASKMVCVTPAGAKYHLRGCRTLERSKRIEEITVERARARGYEPCKVCKPQIV